MALIMVMTVAVVSAIIDAWVRIEMHITLMTLTHTNADVLIRVRRNGRGSDSCDNCRHATNDSNDINTNDTDRNNGNGE